TTVTDGDGNVTTVERDAVGKPMATVAPHLQRTTLGLDANGYIDGITNPAGEATQFTYYPGGLLASLTEPTGPTEPTRPPHLFEYDPLGRLTRDEDPAGGFT